MRSLAVGAGLLGLVLPVAVVKWRTELMPLAPVDEGGPLRPEMVVIPAGTSMIGSPASEVGRRRWEFDQHSVTLTRPFAIGTTEVTQAQYERVVGKNPSTGAPCLACPVTDVSWKDAIDYMNELSDRDEKQRCYEIQDDKVTWIENCDGYRLPTEAEWEVAARAGSSGRYAGTDDPAKICDYANVGDARFKAENPESEDIFDCNDEYAGLAPVASFRPNAYQLYDMTGNVWEWVWDRYGDSPSSLEDPRGPQRGRYRVFRGGSFVGIPQYSRVAHRNFGEPSLRNSYRGFRVARSLP